MDLEFFDTYAGVDLLLSAAQYYLGDRDYIPERTTSLGSSDDSEDSEDDEGGALGDLSEQNVGAEQ